MKKEIIAIAALLLAAALAGCRDPENPGNDETNVEIKVTTYAPTEITDSTALCGGHVTITGTAKIAELSVCWSTEQNPEAGASHLSTTTTDEPFTCTLTGLQPETQYHVRAYALHESEYYYGEDQCFTTLPNHGGDDPEPDPDPEPEPNPEYPEGLLPGLFSVSDTLQVRFSQGNLQYQASTHIWRFAEKQLDYIGDDNTNIGETYDGWIDLFGWGTSGYNHGANAYQPWATSPNYSDYYAYGVSRNSLFDRTGQAEWGYNAIINGGNVENSGWRTLRGIEWKHLLNTRITDSGIRFATARVDGTNGLLVFPDEWDGSYSITEPNKYYAAFENNTISIADWSELEAKGVVFLPASGVRLGGTEMGYMQTSGVYWTSTASSDECAYSMAFIAVGKYRDVDVINREFGAAVRLVKNCSD